MQSPQATSSEPQRRPLLAASSLRVDVDGAPALDEMSLASTGDWILVLGAARALFEAAAGLRAIERGLLRVDGVAPAEAIRARAAAGSPLDPPLPPRWSVSEYVTWSARLAGHARGAARAMAGQAIERLGLSGHGAQRLGLARAAVRRGAVLAAALATGAPVLLIEDPTVGLPDEMGHAFARAIVRATSERRVVFFAPRMRLESPIALAADEAIVAEGSHIAAQGPPAEIAAAERAFALRVVGDVETFVRAVQAQGALLLAGSAALSVTRVAHVSLNLGTLATRDLLRIADHCNAVVVELRPLADAFA